MSSISFIVVIVSSLANMPYLNNQINMYVYKSLIGLSRSDSLRSQFDQSHSIKMMHYCCESIQ